MPILLEAKGPSLDHGWDVALAKNQPS